MRMIRRRECGLLDVSSSGYPLEQPWKDKDAYIIRHLLELEELEETIEEENVGLQRLAASCGHLHIIIPETWKDAKHLKTEQNALYSSCMNITCNSQGEQNDPVGSQNALIPGLQDDMALQCLAMTSRSDYGSVASVNSRFHSLLHNGYLYQFRRQLGIVEHWIYLAWEPSEWEAFDPNRKRWMSLPIVPSDPCFLLSDKESLAVGTDLLVFGREAEGYVIWRYSLPTHSWSRGAPMSSPRCLFGSGSKGEIAVVAGGYDRFNNVLKSAELYNSVSGTWEALPDMHSPRKLCSGFFMDGKFYVIGGMSNDRDSLTCGEEYNLQTRTWRRIPNMFPTGNRAAQAPPLVAVVSDELYALEYSRNEVKKYDKATNTWHVLGKLPLRADAANGWGLGFKACGNELLVIGGHWSSGAKSIVLNAWCPTAEVKNTSWRVIAVKAHAGSFVYNCAVMGC